MEEIRAERGVTIKGTPRKTRSDKRICVKANLTQESHLLLHRLGMTVGKSKTALATEILEVMLKNQHFINWIQDEYKVKDEHRLTPTTVNGKFTY